MPSPIKQALIHHKNLYTLLLKLTYRDITARYKGSKAGMLWTLLTPIILLIVYSFVFGYVFQARWQGTSSENESQTLFALNLFSGMLIHGALSEVLTRNCSIYSAHTNYVKKIIFPLWILPITTALSTLFQASINLLILLTGLLIVQGSFHWQVLLLPFLILPFILTLFGIALLIASIGVYLKDLQQVMPLVTTILLFISPVFYPVSVLPESFQMVMHFNPLTSVIEMLRAVVFLGKLPTSGYMISSMLYGAAIFWVGFSVYKRLKVGFSDVL